MRSFPFLRLPEVPRRQVFQFLESGDLFILSLCSKTSKSVVKSAKIAIYKLRIDFEEDDKLIVAFDKNVITISASESVNLVKLKFGNNWELNTGIGTRDIVIATLREAFRNVKIEIFLSPEALLTNFFWTNHTKSINKLVITHLRELSVDDMEFVMKDLKIKEELSIWSLVSSDFQWSEGFRQKYVYIEFPYWIVDYQSVISSISSYICFSESAIPKASLINNLIKCWISGEFMANLEKFEINLYQLGMRFLSWQVEELLDGVEVQVVSDWQWRIRRSSDKRYGMIRVTESRFKLLID